MVNEPSDEGKSTTNNVVSYDDEKTKRRPGITIRKPAPPQNNVEDVLHENIELKRKMCTMTFERVFPALLQAFVTNGVPLKTDRPDLMKVIKLCADSVEGVIEKFYRLPTPIDIIAENFYITRPDGVVVFKPYEQVMSANTPDPPLNQPPQEA